MFSMFWTAGINSVKVNTRFLFRRNLEQLELQVEILGVRVLLISTVAGAGRMGI